MANLLGVDFGTTSLKAILFNQKGERLKTTSVKYELLTKGEYIEFPAEEFFNVFMSAYNDIATEFSIDAIAIDTQGETLIAVDEDGNALYNAIIWLDGRAEKQAREFEKAFGLEKIYNITGQAEVFAGYPLPKVMWLKENKPEIFNKTAKFLLLEDYIIYRLTGSFSASKSLYSSSLFMNVHTGEYEKQFLDYAGITEDKLPTLYESGVMVGEYKGAKIITSALDQIAGATGAGVIKEGVISETTGTALAVVSVTETFPKYFDGLKVSAYYMKKGAYCLLMWSPTAGATLEWFKKNFAKDYSFNELNKLAENVEMGAEGLICIPHLQGTTMPENNPKVKGSFFGFDLKHTIGHFTRSIFEAVSYNIKEFLEYLGVDALEIRSIGGGANSKIWCEIKSAVLKKKVKTLVENETACLGSAIFAGVGIGVFDSVNTATQKIVKIKREYFSYKDYSNLYLDYKKKEKQIINLF